MLNPVFTRIYFSDEEDANADDLILRQVPGERRGTLVANLEPGSKPKTYRFDIRFQGAGETVFFDVWTTDDQDPSPLVTCAPPSGSYFPRGSTLVTCTATDASGNRSVCTFWVTVLPTIRVRRL